MSAPNITAISVFIEVDGRLCLAPIGSEHVNMFVGMLPAYQSGERRLASLYPVPAEAREHVYQAGQIIGRAITKRGEAVNMDYVA